jgi:Helix-turn-helix domain of resolvase
VQLHRTGEHASAELVELFNVARSTVYRALQCAEQDAQALDAA